MSITHYILITRILLTYIQVHQVTRVGLRRVGDKRESYIIYSMLLKDDKIINIVFQKYNVRCVV